MQENERVSDTSESTCSPRAVDKARQMRQQSSSRCHPLCSTCTDQTKDLTYRIKDSHRARHLTCALAWAGVRVVFAHHTLISHKDAQIAEPNDAAVVLPSLACRVQPYGRGVNDSWQGLGVVVVDLKQKETPLHCNGKTGLVRDDQWLGTNSPPGQVERKVDDKRTTAARLVAQRKRSETSMTTKPSCHRTHLTTRFLFHTKKQSGSKRRKPHQQMDKAYPKTCSVQTGSIVRHSFPVLKDSNSGDWSHDNTTR